jgi:hypothetical protein
MSTGFSSITPLQAKKEILEMRKLAQKLAASPAKARALLVKAGILNKSGKALAKAYQ